MDAPATLAWPRPGDGNRTARRRSLRARTFRGGPAARPGGMAFCAQLVWEIPRWRRPAVGRGGVADHSGVPALRRAAQPFAWRPTRARYRSRLPPDRIREVVTSLLDRRDDLSLVFHGGEPLLRYDLLVDIVTFARELATRRHKMVRYSIQTNAALLDDERIAFLRAHNFSIGISLDGCDEESNAHRVVHGGRSALRAFTDLLESHPNFLRERCGVLAVVSRTSAPGLRRFARWLQGHGIGGLSISFLDLVGRGRDLGSEKLTPDEAVEVYAGFVEDIESGALSSLAVRSVLTRMQNLYTFRPADFCHRGPCAASEEFLVLDATGSMRTCDCVYDPFFEIGGPTTTIDLIGLDHPARQRVVDRHEHLREGGPSCRTCALFGVCGGTCVAKAIASTGDSMDVDPIECAVNTYLYPLLLERFDGTGTSALFAYFQRHRATFTTV